MVFAFWASPLLAADFQDKFEERVSKYLRVHRYNDDPFETCQKLTEKWIEGLTATRCGAQRIEHVLWFVSFELGRWRGAYNRFNLRGGKNVETIGRPTLNVSTCRSGCSYYSTAMLKLPVSIIFNEDARQSGLTIRAFGGPQPTDIFLEPARIEAFRRSLIRFEFIESQSDQSADGFRP